MFMVIHQIACFLKLFSNRVPGRITTIEFHTCECIILHTSGLFGSQFRTQSAFSHRYYLICAPPQNSFIHDRPLVSYWLPQI